MDDQLKLISGAGSMADVMQKYGFLGVGVVLFVVLAGIGWTRDRRMGQVTMAAGLLFIVAYGVLDMLRSAFPDWAGAPSLLSGTVLKVPNSYAVQVHSDWHGGQAFIRRQNDPEDISMSRQSFLFALKHPPKCLAVAVASLDPNHEGMSSLFIVDDTSVDDLQPGSQLVAQVKPGEGGHFILDLWREHNEVATGLHKLLKDQGDLKSDCDGSGGATAWRLPDLLGIATAFAGADPAPVGDLRKALQSDDVFVRRRARHSLAEQGAAGLAQIDALLDSNVYRLQLGALQALNDMPAAERAKAPPTLHDKVRKLLSAPDDDLRQAAGSADRAMR